MNIHLTGVSSLVEAEGKRKRKGSEDSKASLPLPLKKSASHRFRFRFHITALKSLTCLCTPCPSCAKKSHTVQGYIGTL